MRTRQTKEETRRTILDRAYEMYRDGGLDRTDVKVATVLKDLGYTTGAAYYIWPNQAAFRTEFMIHMAENIEYGSLSALGGRIEELHASDPSFEEEILRGADLYLENFLEQENFFINLRFYEMVDPPSEIRAAKSLAYEQMQGHVEQFFAHVLARHGRRMTDESVYGIPELVVTCTAMVEGFTLRYRFQPGKITPSVPCQGGKHHLFSVNLLALVEANTEQI